MYICSTCNYASTTKLGKCPDCGSFGTMQLVPGSHTSTRNKTSKTTLTPTKVRDPFVLPVSHRERKRLFGDGIQSGGVYLLGGEPGIGKSTLLLQLLHHLHRASDDCSLAYISGEEHHHQINQRYQRLYQDQQAPFDITHSSDLTQILEITHQNNYDFVIIDSIQTLQAESGLSTIAALRTIAHECMSFAKQHNTAILLVGHVTKSGDIAGPKYLEHIVDVVMYLQGERDGHYRTVRLHKNRFGSTDESALFEMTATGLSPVQDRSQRVLSAHTTGSILSIALDNGRPILIEVQALLTPSYHKHPQRTCVGRNSKRVDMIIAVLTKYCKLQLYKYDIYLNIPGETTFIDNGLDLAVAAAIISQYKNNDLGKKSIFIGEIGLSGHIAKSRLHTKRTKNIPDGYLCTDHTSLSHITSLAQ